TPIPHSRLSLPGSKGSESIDSHQLAATGHPRPWFNQLLRRDRISEWTGFSRCRSKSIRRRSANSLKPWGSAPNNPVNPVNPEILSSLGDQWGQSRLNLGIGNREWGIDKAIRPLPPPPDFINSRKSASPFPIPNDSPFPIADSQG